MKVKVIIPNMCFWIALFLNIFIWFVGNTNFRLLIPDYIFFEDTVRFAIIGLILLRLLFKVYWHKSMMWKIGGVFIVVISTYFISGYASPIMLLILILGAYGIDKEKIIKYASVITTMFSIVTIIAANIGIIENDVYMRSGEKLVTAQGFANYATIPIIILALNLCYIYLSQTLNYGFILFGIDILIYFIFKNRMTMVLEIIMYALCFLLSNREIINKMWIEKLAFTLPSLSCMITLLLTWLYGKGSMFVAKINDWLSWRLYYNWLGIIRYPLSVFGQQVSMRGNLAIGRESKISYYYIDSGYMYSIVAYGIALTIVLLVFYSFSLKHVVKHNKIKMFIVLFIITIANTVENMWINTIYNPFILVLLNEILPEFSVETFAQLKRVKHVP